MGKATLLIPSDCIDGLTSTDTAVPLSANQGRFLSKAATVQIASYTTDLNGYVGSNPPEFTPVTVTIKSTDFSQKEVPLVVKDESGLASAAIPLTIATQGSETIEEESTYKITKPFGSATMVYSGGNAKVISTNNIYTDYQQDINDAGAGDVDFDKGMYGDVRFSFDKTNGLLKLKNEHATDVYNMYFNYRFYRDALPIMHVTQSPQSTPNTVLSIAGNSTIYISTEGLQDDDLDLAENTTFAELDFRGYKANEGNIYSISGTLKASKSDDIYSFDVKYRTVISS